MSSKPKTKTKSTTSDNKKLIELDISLENEEFYEELMEDIPSIDKSIIKSWKDKGGDITISEARFLIDFYYDIQKLRIHLSQKVSALERDAKNKAEELGLDKTDRDVILKLIEPHDALKWSFRNYALMEKEIYKLLKIYAENHEMFWFFDQTCGIGPVLASNFIAYIDIKKAPTPGHIWSYAGIVGPKQKWEKGKKRPWNASLKRACFLAGESFVKVKNRKNDFYGKVYQERKDYEWRKNLLGHFKDQALEIVNTKNFDKTTDAYNYYIGNIDPKIVGEALSSGELSNKNKYSIDKLKLCDNDPRFPMLPPDHIHSRARRYAVKLFLSHLHECWFEQETHFKAPRPWILGKEDENGNLHTQFIPPPQKKPYKIPTEYMENNEQRYPPESD